MAALTVLCSLIAAAFSADDPPNIDQATYSYNILLGQTPYEQRNDLVGDQLFFLSNSDTSDDGEYVKHDQIDDLSTNAGCFYEEKSNEFYWSTSSSTLQRQSDSSSNGYDQQTSIGVDGSSAGIPITAETNIRNALIFSNSQTSETQESASESGYTYTFDASANRRLYAIEIDWNGIDDSDWNPDIISAVEALGSSPSTQTMFAFIRDYGTHGLSTATFGQVCVTAAFMEGGSSASSYYSFNQDTSANEVGFLWWSSSSSSSESESSIEESEQGFKYYYGNKYCRGELDYDSSCGGGMVASGIERPAITRWLYKPMWEMEIPGFEDGAKDKLEEVVNGIYVAGYTCRNNYCSGQGTCAANADAWSVSSWSSSSYSQFWDGSRCFCDENYEGDDCSDKIDVIMDLDTSWTGYKNTYDNTLNYYTTTGALCGMQGVHDNGKEDRRFAFEVCQPEDDDFSQTGNMLTVGTTDYDGTWGLYCDSDKVAIGFNSWHNNGKEDRRWKIYCKKLSGTTTTNCGLSDDYVNSFDSYFKESCDDGQVLHGLYSYHDNGKEDRRFKFHCCDLQRENDYKSVSVSSWSGYQNNWDDSHTTSSYSSNKVFCGVSSYHDNGKEDRRVRFKYCRPSSATLDSHSSWSGYSNWDASWSYTCSYKYFITDWNSYHDNGKEDRRYRFRCGRYSGTESTSSSDCYWTPYVNDFDGSLSYVCGDGQAINGVASYHDNGKEDRRFKFRCCRLKVPS